MLLYFQKSAVRLLHGRIIRIYSSYMKRSPAQKQKGGDWWEKRIPITKNYMKENRVFADAFNYLLYNGQQMIQPEKLREIDTTEMAILQGGDQKHQDSETVQKYRDILKKTVVKEDGETVYLLLGVENQTDIHYAMPVRNLIYDALQYGKQVSDITAENRKTGKKRSGGEYLSGF